MNKKESKPRVEPVSQGKLKIYSGFVHGYQVTRLVEAAKMVVTFRRAPWGDVDDTTLVYTDGTTAITRDDGGWWNVETIVAKAGLPVTYTIRLGKGNTNTNTKRLAQFEKMIPVPKLGWSQKGDDLAVSFSDKQTLAQLGVQKKVTAPGRLSPNKVAGADGWTVQLTPVPWWKLVFVEFWYGDDTWKVTWARAYRAPRFQQLCRLLGVYDGD